MDKINNFHDAWWWLVQHPIFGAKGSSKDYNHTLFTTYCLDISVQLVNPITRRIEDDEDRNTHTEVWLESGPIEDIRTCNICCGTGFEEDINDRNATLIPCFACSHHRDTGIPSHDYDLDCGGDTFEEAIMKLAKLVFQHYGDYNKEEATEP